MANLVLAVYAASQVYLERFVCFASEHKELGFQIQGFTDLLLLERFLSSRREDAVLLFLDEEDKQVFREHSTLIQQLQGSGGYVFIIGRSPECTGWETFLREEGYEDKIRYIHRYQSALQILMAVRSFFPEEPADAAAQISDSLPWLAGMYSPMDKVCHPQAAASIMKGKKKVLYINLEQFSGFSEDIQEFSRWEDQIGPDSEKDPPTAFQCTVSDLIYCYKQTPGKLHEVLNKSIKKKQDFDILLAPEELADLEELNEKEWPEFLRAVARAGDYHFIFLDMSVFDWKLIDMVLSYGELYIPALPYDPEKTFRSVLTRKNGEEQNLRQQQAAKLKAFRRYFKERGRMQELQKIREVYLEPD